MNQEDSGFPWIFAFRTPFKINLKGNRDLEGERARDGASLPYDFEQIVW
jgi:hypothetical protein